MTLTRRHLLATATATWFAGMLPARLAADDPAPAMPLRSSRDIAASPISLGWENAGQGGPDDAVLPQVVASGAKWCRLRSNWQRCERARGAYDLAWIGKLVDGLRDGGVQPWLELGQGNPLYAPAGVSVQAWPPIDTPEALAAWRAYVRALATALRGRVRHFEVWNEPEFAKYWQPKPDPAAYVRLVRETVAELRAALPDAVIVGGVVTVLPRGLDFVQDCLAAGLAPLIDRFSYHPYRAVPEAAYAAEVRTLRGLLAATGRDIPLWMGEGGCPSTPQSAGALAHLEWTEDVQARWLLRRFATDLGLGLELASWFTATDRPAVAGDPASRPNTKGLLRADASAKPSYTAFRRVCALFDAATRRADLLLHVAPTTRVNQFWDSQEAPLPADPLHTATFVRRDRPLALWWDASVLQEGERRREVSLLLWPGRDLRLDAPVLCDPLLGTVAAVEVVRDGGFVRLNPAPVRNYPLILTDRAALA